LTAAADGLGRLPSGPAYYHTGIVVPTLDDGMAVLGSLFDLTWRTNHLELALRAGAEDQHVDLLVAYSIEGPPYIELIEGVPNTVWEPAAHPYLHHVGSWVDDLPAAVADAERAGFDLAAAGRDPTNGRSPRGFSYHRAGDRVLLELVDVQLRPDLERWLSPDND
jgi:hypothetical protein